MLRRAPLLALLLTLALLAGCGAEADGGGDLAPGAEQDAAVVVEDLEQAAADDDAEEICSRVLSDRLRDQLGRGCTRAVDRAFDQTDTLSLEVRDVRVTGDRARAEVESGRDGEQVETVELVRQRNGWRIDRFGGAVPARG